MLVWCVWVLVCLLNFVMHVQYLVCMGTEYASNGVGMNTTVYSWCIIILILNKDGDPCIAG